MSRNHGSTAESSPPPDGKEVKIPQTGTRMKPLTIGENFAAPKDPKKRRTPNTDKSKRERDAREVEERREANDWESARPGHMVALYAMCHEKIYGFIPNELDKGKEYALAVLSAARMLKGEFRGESKIMVEFIRWTWRREQSREKWRRERGQGGQRIGWRLQFNGSMVSDYRVDLARRKGNAER